MSQIPVNILIKCRKNTIDGRKKKGKSLYMYRLCLEKKKLRHRRLLWHRSEWQSVFEPSNSGCALVSGPPVTHPKGCLLQRHFSKERHFFRHKKKKERNKKKNNNTTLHIRTFTNTKADAECGGAHFTVCQIDLNTPSLLNHVSRKMRKKLNESTDSSNVN